LNAPLSGLEPEFDPAAHTVGRWLFRNDAEP
jgi:hypothetical protein